MIAVRWLHVLGMALVLGGAVATWWLFRQSAAGSGDGDEVGSRSDATAIAPETALGVAVGYERGFWGSMGVLVMTGVGNLGSLAPYVPAPGTPWGTAFAVKLLVVIAILVLSLVRTFVVHRCRRAETVPETAERVLRVGYGATALALAIAVALAEVLAHG